MDKKRELLFSVRLKDCRVDTFRSGGKGGQNQNKVESGVRIVHEPSGAVGESRETRSQVENKKRAWRRLGESVKFKIWVMKEVDRLTGRGAQDEVDRMMMPKNIKVEYQQEDGSWSLNS